MFKVLTAQVVFPVMERNADGATSSVEDDTGVTTLLCDVTAFCDVTASFIPVAWTLNWTRHRGPIH